MSRSIDREESERLHEEHAQSRMTLSQGRVGGSGSSDGEDERRGKSGSRAGGQSSSALAELASLIDQAATDRPTVSEFIERLKNRGVEVVPSLQSSGRWNGIVYRYGGESIKGSSVGREYTAQGLQTRKGVQYDPQRDGPVLERAVESAGLRRPEMELASHARARNREQVSASARMNRTRDRETGLSADQKATLAEIGKFRTLAVNDLVRYRYAGEFGRTQQDLRRLCEQGLAERRTIQTKDGRPYAVVVLTRKGRNLKKSAEKASDIDSAQQYYAGFVKPAEVRHDMGIYRVYQVEAEKIEREGGTVKRVVLDYELKRKVFSALNKDGEKSALLYASRKEQVASQNGLPVVNGRVAFPDLRIEYETREGDLERVDVELATADYKNAEVATKRAAGFTIYGPDSSPRSPALQDPEIVAGLISL